MSTNIFLIEDVRSLKPSTKNDFVFLPNDFTDSPRSENNLLPLPTMSESTPNKANTFKATKPPLRAKKKTKK